MNVGENTIFSDEFYDNCCSFDIGTNDKYQPMLRIDNVSQKVVHQTDGDKCQFVTDFQNSFTDVKRTKFLTKPLLYEFCWKFSFLSSSERISKIR